MSDNKQAADLESRRSISDDEIVTERKLVRRSFLSKTGAVLAGAAGVVVGARAWARNSAQDPDKRPADPDKRPEDPDKRPEDRKPEDRKPEDRKPEDRKPEDRDKRPADPDKRPADPDKPPVR